jgi:hypothetical protein
MIVLERILICDGCPRHERIEGTLRSFRYLLKKAKHPDDRWIRVLRDRSMKDFCGECVKAGRHK